MLSTQNMLAALVVCCVCLMVSPEIFAQRGSREGGFQGPPSRSGRPGSPSTPGTNRSGARSGGAQPTTGPSDWINEPNPDGSARSNSRGNSRSSNRASTSGSRTGGRRPTRPSSESGGASVFDTNKLIAYFDGDGDGQLSLDEIDAASRLLYALDANADDRLTADEMDEFGGEGQGSMRSNASNRPSSNSRDDSRSTASNSAPAPPSAPRSSGRRSGRGSIQGVGIGSIGAAGASASGGKSNDKADFNKSDKNNDGFLTRNELSARLRAKFSKMDGNGDREVDPDEFDAYMNDPNLNGGVIK